MRIILRLLKKCRIIPNSRCCWSRPNTRSNSRQSRRNSNRSSRSRSCLLMRNSCSWRMSLSSWNRIKRARWRSCRSRMIRRYRSITRGLWSLSRGRSSCRWVLIKLFSSSSCCRSRWRMRMSSMCSSRWSMKWTCKCKWHLWRNRVMTSLNCWISKLVSFKKITKD